MNDIDLRRLDLNLFRVFDAIYREGGLTRAADKLFVTQPAVSHALARLRESCGDELFVKSGRVMVPTARARAMAPVVQAALAQLGAAIGSPAAFDPAQAQRVFTLGLREVQEPFALRALWPQVVPPTGGQTPTESASPAGLSISLVRLDRDRLEDDLRLGVLDAALDVHLPVSRHIGRAKVMSDPMVVLARRDHPRVQGRLTLDAYLREDHALVSTRRSGLGLEDTALSLLGHERRIRLRCQHYLTACEAVAASDLLLTLPRRHALESNAAWHHQVLEAPCDLPPLDVYLYWDHGLDADPAHRWLRRVLLQAADPGLQGQSPDATASPPTARLDP